MKRIAVCILISCLGVRSQASGQTGAITTVAGSDWVFPANVTVALNAPLGNVYGVAVDYRGNIYAADASNNRVFLVSPVGAIQIVAGNGTVVSKVCNEQIPGSIYGDTQGRLLISLVRR